MARRLVKILILAFLFTPFILAKKTFAAVSVQITSYKQSTGVGETFPLTVSVTGLTQGQTCRIKVGIAGIDETYFGHGYVLSSDNDWVGYNESGSWGRAPNFAVTSDSLVVQLKAMLSVSGDGVAAHIGVNNLRMKICFADSASACTSSPKNTTAYEDVSLSVTESSPPDPDEPPPASPPLDSSPPCPSGISLSEFMANPPTDGQEWVEIYNSTSITLDLSGWQIDDIEGASAPRVFDVLGFKPASFYAIYFTSSKLNDGGDSVRLLCPDGNVLETFAFEKATDGWSWAKDENGSWKETSTPTPNGKNVITLPKKDKPKGSNDEVDEEEALSEVGATAPDSSSGKVLGATEENQGEITPEAASDYRPEKPPKWRVGKVEAEATEATSPSGKVLEASAGAMVNLSKGMMFGGGLVTVSSLLYFFAKGKKII